jgi:Right handed beta helix region
MNGSMIRRVVVVSLFLAVIVVPRASAQAARVFLSGTGSDSGDCSNAATPCRSLQGAINQAAAGAEVVVVSSGGYGGAMITKSISVNAPTGVIAFVGRTITVTIASTDTVTLRGLSMNGAVFGDADGIAFTAGGTLNIENTVISSFASVGVYDTASGSKLWVHNCDVKKNIDGIYVLGASAVIEDSRAVENSSVGMWADNSSTVAIRNSVAEGNTYGFYAQAAAGTSTELVVDSCMSTNNGVGLQSSQIGTGSVATLRAGQNIVMNNTGANLVTSGGGSLISQGGNRVGGATGGTTGFTSTVAQQ